MMPELPEMENYKQLLYQKIKGQSITNVVVNRDKSLNRTSSFFTKQVQGQRIVSVERRAKHLLFRLENGYVMLLHLMLGGWMYFGTETDKPDRTIQIQLSFGNQKLYFIGLRLGYLHLHTKEEVTKELEGLGPEPLEVNFSITSFIELVSKRRGRIKTTLVNQKFISGIGNCYSDEIAWHAELLPTKKMNELDDSQLAQLYRSIQFVLQQATQYGGYMDQPLFNGDRKTGGYNDRTYVYDREGKPCNRCGEAISKEEVSSRKTFYCKGCQS